jgi:DNA-binding transcriptional LysR family regulator
VLPTDLDQHQGIVYNLSGGATWTFTKGGEQQTQTLSRLRVSAAEGLRAAVLADQGLAIASQWMFAPELASGAVRAVMDDWRCRIRTCGRCSHGADGQCEGAGVCGVHGKLADTPELNQRLFRLLRFSFNSNNVPASYSEC